MIAALRMSLRMTLSMVLGVLACGLFPPSGAVAAGMDCELDLSNPAAVRQRADAVTDVFAGEVRAVTGRAQVAGGGSTPSVEPPTNRHPKPTGWEYRVLVKVPFRSDQQPGDVVRVATAPVSTGGLGQLKVDQTYVFFVSGERGTKPLVADACSGTQELPHGLSARLQASLHDALAQPTDGQSTPDYSLTAPEDGTRTIPDLGRLAAPGVAVALIGLLGLVLLSRIGARRRS